MLQHAFISRWLFSTKHTDIGSLYILLGLFSGILGTTFSILMRMELSAPGNQIFLGNHQAYNIVVTLHGMMMIFL